MYDDATYWDTQARYAIDAAVIDPNDTLGHKNAYIAELRDESILESLPDDDGNAPILDFGCGTGGLTAVLQRGGLPVIGVDVSLGLLKRYRERGPRGRSLVLQYDGCTIPIGDRKLRAACTYGVLMYLPDELLLHLLTEISRTLKSDGRLIVMEQFRRRQKMMDKDGKLHRSVADFLCVANSAGLTSESTTICRYGHFPFLYAIRLGLVPHRFFHALRTMERSVGRLFGLLPWDYTDVRIVLRKSI